MSVNIKVENLAVFTEGLEEVNIVDIKIVVVDDALVPDAMLLMRYIVNYIVEQKAIIRTGETLAYGYWRVKFQYDGHKYLEVWEFDRECCEYIPGVTLAVTYLKIQTALCSQYDAKFFSPLSHDYAIVSDGVFEGESVEGVRYPSLAGMSGWWFTTDLYNNDLKSLKTVHLFHVTSRRPELAQYLALPYGYWFSLSPSEEHVAFDPNIAAEEPA